MPRVCVSPWDLFFGYMKGGLPAAVKRQAHTNADGYKIARGGFSRLRGNVPLDYQSRQRAPAVKARPVLRLGGSRRLR